MNYSFYFVQLHYCPHYSETSSQSMTVANSPGECVDVIRVNLPVSLSISDNASPLFMARRRCVVRLQTRTEESSNPAASILESSVNTQQLTLQTKLVNCNKSKTANMQHGFLWGTRCPAVPACSLRDESHQMSFAQICLLCRYWVHFSETLNRAA